MLLSKLAKASNNKAHANQFDGKTCNLSPSHRSPGSSSKRATLEVFS